MKKDRTYHVGLALVFLAGPLLVISLSLPWWHSHEEHFFGDTWKINTGLWKTCKETTKYYGETHSACKQFDTTDEYVSTARRMLVVSLLLLAGGTLAVLVQKCSMAELVFLSYLGTLAVAAAGFLSWLGLVEYAKGYVLVPGNYPANLRCCFWLAFVSSITMFIVACLFAVSRLRGF